MLRILTAFITALLLLLSSSCTGEDAQPTNEQIRMLQQQNQELESHLISLAEEVSKLKAAVISKQTGNSPLVSAAFQPDGSHTDDPFLGPKDASIIVMAFSDYQCKPCRDFYSQTFSALKENFIDSEKIKFIFRDFPLTSNKHSLAAANLAHCAGEQGAYWRMHNYLFESKEAVDQGSFDEVISGLGEVDSDKLKKCFLSGRYNEEIKRDISEAKLLGAKGAPGFFVGNRDVKRGFRGVFIRGAQPYGVFKERLEILLQENSS